MAKILHKEYDTLWQSGKKVSLSLMSAVFVFLVRGAQINYQALEVSYVQFIIKLRLLCTFFWDSVR